MQMPDRAGRVADNHSFMANKVEPNPRSEPAADGDDADCAGAPGRYLMVDFACQAVWGAGGRGCRVYERTANVHGHAIIGLVMPDLAEMMRPNDSSDVVS